MIEAAMIAPQELNLTPGQIARASDVDVETARRWLAGQPVRPRSIERIARGLARLRELGLVPPEPRESSP
jgi:hypothetical protein